jgi:alkylhydroperoxidase/carboxymuconolactone decarboxylase family protein YurZ
MKATRLEMKKNQDEILRYYKEELNWNPPFAGLLQKYLPDALNGYLIMRDSVNSGALPAKYRELIFTLLDSIDDELAGAKAHSIAALKAGLTPQEMVEAFTIVAMVKGINVMCKSGVEVIKEAENYLTKNDKVK